MTRPRLRAADTGRKSEAEEKRSGGKSGKGSEEECRCEEVSKKTFPELIKLMLRDLVFWKKKE
jgi:hypothetical protein